MKHIELSDLNHRMLIEKCEKIYVPLKNMDILYTSGSEQTMRYTKTIVKYAEDIEKITEGACGQANHEIIMNNQIEIEPMKPTSADEIFMRYEN